MAKITFIWTSLRACSFSGTFHKYLTNSQNSAIDYHCLFHGEMVEILEASMT